MATTAKPIEQPAEPPAPEPLPLPAPATPGQAGIDALKGPAAAPLDIPPVDPPSPTQAEADEIRAKHHPAARDMQAAPAAGYQTR